jgi:tetratricopeptide (TPR) repeat protein
MFIVAVMAITLLCLPASGQTTAQDWYKKGAALDDQGKYDEAIQAFDNAIGIDPKDVDAWNYKGIALHKLGKYDEAIKAYDKAIELDYLEDTYAWYNKGLTLYQQGKYDEAIQAYDKAIETDPKDADAWNHKGIALGKLGLTAESNEAIAKAKELGYTGVSEDSIVGKWINRYDWGCTGSPTQGELNFKGDGTVFDDKDAKGKWTRTGDNIHIKWDTGPAVYDGTIQTNTMGGVLSGAENPPATGC